MEPLNINIKDGTKEKIKGLLQQGDCKDMTEFVQKAIDYYAAFLSCKENEGILSSDIQKCISAAVAVSEGNIRKLMYKQAVQIGMINSVLMMQTDIDRTNLERLKGKVIRDLNETIGTIEMENIAYELDLLDQMEAAASIGKGNYE